MNIDRIIKITLSLLLFLIVWCFWTIKYPYILAFQEQTQMFLFDTEFFVERITMPCGLARYVAEFFVQLYNNVILGGVIIACILVSLQVFVYRLIKSAGRSSIVCYVLSFVPSLLLWYHLGAIMTRYTFPIALLMAVLTILFCPKRENRIVEIIYMLVCIPLLAWIAGPVVLILALYIGLRDIIPTTGGGIKCSSHSYVVLPLLLLYSVVSIYLCGMFAPVAMTNLFYGINYSFTTLEFPQMQYLVMLSIVLVPMIVTLIPEVLNKKKNYIVAGTLCTVSVICSLVYFPKRFSGKDYEVLHYDMLLRGQKWVEIIKMAEKKNPDTPLTVASLNLALAMNGELSSRGNQFFQNGIQGAFPMFNMDFTTSIVTSEIYYYLGLVNIAERLAFEGMEGIPDNSLSVRVVKRLAEINIINGQYDVAKKYLLLLKETMFYSKWANRMIETLGDEKFLNEHPLYGKLHTFLLDEDFLFSEKEIESTLFKLFMQNKDNSVAIQYLLFIPQLEGNQNKYLDYLDFVKRTLKGDCPDPAQIMTTYNLYKYENIDANTSASIQQR